MIPSWSALLTTWLTSLSESRPVFHPEADFQHALAWTAHLSDPTLRIRLEIRAEPGTYLDLLISRPEIGAHLAVELKYFTAAWSGTHAGEHFKLLNQGAQDVRCYDAVRDIQRVESFTSRNPAWTGAVLILTNDPSYWTRPSHARITNADAFRIHEGRTLNGQRAWGPNTGDGTKKNREPDLYLRGSYTCAWTDYSTLPGSRGTFRLLRLTPSIS